MTTTITCPVCRAEHERRRGNMRTIFCRCGSVAAFDAWLGWYWWFRRARAEPVKPETQTEARGCAGAECDL